MNDVAIECKQQEVKVDTDAGLVDALTVQIILSSSCLRQLLLTFSMLTELLYGHKALDNKQYVKQADIVTLTDLVQVENLSTFIRNRMFSIEGISNQTGREDARSTANSYLSLAVSSRLELHRPSLLVHSIVSSRTFVLLLFSSLSRRHIVRSYLSLLVIA